MKLQAEVDQITQRFSSIWPTVTEANTEAPKDMISYMFVEWCDHIQMACAPLAATNAEMR